MSSSPSSSSQVRNREKLLSSSSSNGRHKEDNDIAADRKMKRGGAGRTGRKFYVICVLLLLGVCWGLFFSGGAAPGHSVGWWDEAVYLPLGLSRESYAVVLDAGSTGTRVTAFAFHQSVNGRSYRFLKLKLRKKVC